MNDYMTALYERFQIETPELSVHSSRTASAEETLKDTLDADQRKLLLRLVDCQSEYRQEAAICGFITGWRLANGIRDEMNTLPRFSIANEDEQRALKQFSSDKRSEYSKGEGNMSQENENSTI